MASDVKAVVLYTLYRWTDDDGVHEAHKGDEISVSADEFKRGSEMDPPALAKPGSGAAKDAAAAAAAPAAGAPPIPGPDPGQPPSGESLPGTHAELDALAADRGVTFPDGTKTVADKQAVLAAAAPPAEPT